MEHALDTLVKELSENKSTLKFIGSDDFSGTEERRKELIEAYKTKIKSLESGIKIFELYHHTGDGNNCHIYGVVRF